MRERVPTEVPTDSRSLATAVDPPRTPEPEPEAIGRFEVLRELGRGGMGVVYEAHDARLDRRVAIKLVALERVGERGRARVRREARALARLSHPNVVQVFEVGEVDDSLFLAMEHVEGQTLRQWVGAAPRGWQEVLAVYRQAAAGLAAAHDKGLVHRDFKPDNAIIGADGRVRVIDFGLAREPDREAFEDSNHAPSAVSGSAQDDALTETGAVLGTPAYMAKEQFLGRQLDARTDQFALCVSLFEALYGQRPFEGATRLALADAVTRGRMVAPPEAHGVPPWVLAALRRGLQHEPSARFPDVRALSAALEPRRRGRWVALGLVALAVIGTSLWASTEPPPCQDAAREWATVWSHEQREAVGHALASAPVPYAEHARVRVLETLDAYGAGWVQEHTAACTATRVLAQAPTELMERRMACLDSGRRRFVALVELLADADADVAEHAVQAAAALPAVARCADERLGATQAEHAADPEIAPRVEALRADLDVAIAWHDAGRHAPALERLTAVAVQAEPLGYLPLLAEARLRLGIAQDAMGEHGAAVQSLRAAFFDARSGGLDEVAARAATHLVFEEGYRLDRYEAADAWAEHAWASLDRLGAGSLEPALHMAVANVELARARYPAARAGYQRAVDGFTAALGPDHPRVAMALGNLANAELSLGNLEAAAALHERVLELERRTLGPSHPEVARTSFNLGSVHLAMGRYDDALEQLRASLAIDTAALGPRHPSIASTRASIAAVYNRQGELERALPEQQAIVELVEEIHGDDGIEVADVLSDMAGTLRELGRDREALELLRRAVDIVEQRLPPSHADVGQKLSNLALVEEELGQHEAALGHIRRVLAIYEQALPPLHNDRSKSYMLLSEILESRGELAAARAAAMTALALREQGRPSSVGALARARMTAARLTWETGGDRALARAMACQARDEFLAGAGDWAHAYAGAEEWLDLHRPSP